MREERSSASDVCKSQQPLGASSPWGQKPQSPSSLLPGLLASGYLHPLSGSFVLPSPLSVVSSGKGLQLGTLWGP